MIKILFLFRNIDGGTGTYLEGLLNIGNVFKGEKIVTKILVLNKPNYSKRKINYDFLFDNISMRNKITMKSLFQIIREIIWFKNNTVKFKPNIVFSSDSHAIFVSGIAKLIFCLKFKRISIIHNNIREVIKHKSPIFSRELVRFLLSLFLSGTDNNVVTVSKKLSDDVFDYFRLKRKPVTIECVLPSWKDNIEIFESQIKDDVVISVARFDQQKDHKTLLHAFKKVLDVVPDCKLWLIGDGPEKDNMQRLTRDLDITENVVFFGWIQSPQKLYKKSKIFVLSSNWEGFPLTLIEAMMNHIPVIATNCEFGPSEIIGRNKYGFLVPMKDEKSLADKIVRLLKNDEMRKRYTIAGYERSKKYVQDTMLKKYKDIITSKEMV